ncbi:Uncharacterised protein [Vibrio cholerae]|nr:Uncharacterised protein [Vibrio cholerae]CSC67195.1 Uncharacterised protein [Vibrio cholerae]CSD12612.1 Uncharacterised protein [Vibrio cholerae]
MFLHKFRHIHTYHGIFTVKQEVSQGFTQLGFTDPCWPQE